ncbi:hypothetical protein SprV_0301205400 [Sparganum proliferum]
MDRNEWKSFSVTKAVYGPPIKATVPLLSVDGSILLTEKTNSTTMGRALQRRPQTSLHHLRRRYRPSAVSGDQRRPPDRLDVALLSLPAHHLHFGEDLTQRLVNIPIAAAAADVTASVENRWCQLRDKVQPTTLAVLVRARCQHQDWFDDDSAISKLLPDKNRLHKTYVTRPTDDNKAAFHRCRRLVQQRLRETQDACTVRKTKAIQAPTALLYSLKRHKFYNDVPSTSEASSTAPPPSPTLPSFVCLKWRLKQTPTFRPHHEAIKAVKLLTSGKAPGSDAIPAEIYKRVGPQLMDYLTELFQGIMHQREVPQDFKDATIMHPHRQQRNHQICDNHRGISLLNIAGRIIARILLNHLNNHLEEGFLPESQCGFRRHRGDTDMIFAARQLQDKCRKMRTHLYSTFVNLTKALNTVNRGGPWEIMQKFGCPERFTQMVRQFHDMMVRVMENGVV